MNTPSFSIFSMININMRCIEINYNNITDKHEAQININMRCIEMSLNHVQSNQQND